MSALYRQARPTTFDEMVGQEHVKEVLLGALRSKRLAQAYLFSGPRGVGKTSSARLIAQAVSCTGPEPRPCGACEGCRLVREGRHPDVLEIDAASNNSVEDVRDLRERILLAPILSPQDKKVVILDEAHMMSKSAFNALLKTLEEPPEHIIFIFATTEPERMPPTILSRTQHFRFRRLSEEEIVRKLRRILAGLGREAEGPALELVARLADGAMRDAESLLDRLLTLEGAITLSGTEAALGLPPQEALFAVAKALDRGQVKGALEGAQNLYTQGFAARTLAQGLLEAIRAGLYGRMGLGVGPHLDSPEERLVAAMTALDEALERLLKRSDALSLELAVLAAYQALHGAGPVTAAQSLPAPNPQASLPDFDPRPQRNKPGTPVPGPRSGEALNAQPSSPNPQPPRPEPQTPISRPQASGIADFNQAWRDVLARLKPTQKAFFREAHPYPPEGNRFVLVFTEDKSFHYQNALKHVETVQQVVRDTLGDYEVEVRLGGKKKVAEPDFSPSSPRGLAQPTANVSVAPEPPSQPIPQPPSPASAAPEPPPKAPWFPEAPPFEKVPLEAEPPDSKPMAAEENLLEDPRFQQLLKLFGGRLRKFHRETRPNPEAEVSSETELTEE